MGCDIHMKVQARDSEGNPWKVLPQDLAWEDRNYTLFSVLANVRNGTWNDEIPYISEPRGWPTDQPVPEDWEVVEESLDEDKFFWGDHSNSWVTVAELLAYNWDNPVTMRAVVEASAFQELERTRGTRWENKPQEYYAGASNTVSEDEARKLLSRGEDLGNRRVSTTWKSTVGEQVHLHALQWILRLARLPYRPENIRLVFNFDS